MPSLRAMITFTFLFFSGLSLPADNDSVSRGSHRDLLETSCSKSSLKLPSSRDWFDRSAVNGSTDLYERGCWQCEGLEGMEGRRLMNLLPSIESLIFKTLAKSFCSEAALQSDKVLSVSVFIGATYGGLT
ncbi:hypothetical protein ARMSODRAFT_972758 [Armillaria solidipes]|uniref:Secreted protein n=1 Tax=Armillaria solidipes TaxID=1076256 RepID=A0A2H3C9V2_9AGAR|nr:hypothetical protein ARMSODRAFT_972758 [Armillaria solidipes]